MLIGSIRQSIKSLPVWLFATGHSWIGADASDAGWALAIVMLLTLPGYRG